MFSNLEPAATSRLMWWLMLRSVPVWFYWDKAPFYVTPLESWIHDEYDISDDKPITVAPTNATGHVLPLVPHSGQRHGEMMKQFFPGGINTTRS